MVNKENKIRDLLNSLEENLNESINDNIEIESFDGHQQMAQTNYDFMEDIEVLLFDIGKILDNKDLIEMFKKPRTIEEIAKDINDNNTYFEDIEELEVIETTRDAERVPKYIYEDQIVKHIPSGKFYLFSTQTQGDYYSGPEFMGEVAKKEIITTKWVVTT
jgi:hypothetical protein